MSEANKDLAELMGWKYEARKESPPGQVPVDWVGPCWWSPEGKEASPPAYNTDHNAMATVYLVLKERGLWDEFIKQWDKDRGYAGDMYAFLTDLPGQVQAAIKVLKAKG